MTQPLRVVVVGAGSMGRAWLSTVRNNPDVTLVGLVDIDLDVAQASLDDDGTPGVVVGTDLREVASTSSADAVINVTVPAAHHPVTTAALFAGYPVLGEKPVAETVAQALSLAAASQVTGVPFVVSQSRRYNMHAFAYREQVRALGEVGMLSTEFFKAPHFGGFRDEMDFPLLIDMAIHQFDLARFLLDADPVAVHCESFNPPWSWYRGDAAAVATFEMTGGTRYTFAGSWCSPGLETSWNGAWRASGAAGSACWNGDDWPVLDADAEPAAAEQPAQELAGSLASFEAGIRRGGQHMCLVSENVLSLAMVEAAVESARTDTRVLIDDVLASALLTAVAQEKRGDVRDQLLSWTSVRDGLAG